MSALSMYIPCPPPKTDLGRYRILSSTAGVRVSPLALGTMSLGTAWAADMKPVDETAACALLDAFVDAGGNFIDTANNYQDEQTEQILGRWMAARGNRDQLFVATKYTTNYRAWQLGGGGASVNYAGNHKKAMVLSVAASLRKLQTTYVDLLYVHWWDWTTSVEELMDALHLLVVQGKVLYLGVSDTPAWVVSAANEYARAHGKTPFSVYQGRWNVLSRDLERDVLPMARRYGMAICPWDVLGGGRLQSTAQLATRRAAGEGLRALLAPAEQSDDERRVSEALEAVAAAHGSDVSIQQVAIAYVLRKASRVFPLVGGRKIDQLHDSIGALRLRLTDDQVRAIEAVKPFDVGFPMTMLGDDPAETGTTPPGLVSSAHYGWQRAAKPVGYE